MTRYPKSGKGRKWTVAELKAIHPAWCGDTLRDGDGLAGTIRCTPDGAVAVHFRYAYKRQGKKAWHYCGTWPAASLEEIRTSRDRARDDLKRRLDPNTKRTADRIEEQQRVQETIAVQRQRLAEDACVSDMFAAWLKDGVVRKDGNAELRRSFDKDVLPKIGNKAVRTVAEHDLRDLLRAMVARGVNRMAVAVSRDLRQMFAWAEKRQPWRRLLQEGNPADLVEIETIVDADYDLFNIRNRTLSAAEIRELRDIFERMTSEFQSAADKRKATRPVQPETQCALWISLATSCRIGELLKAEWKHVDLQAATWYLPKENVKGARGKKQDQLVSLSTFALKQFKTLHGMTGKTDWCFPSRDRESHVDVKSVSKQVGDRQHRLKQRTNLQRRRNDNSLVLASGANGEWTPHDLRRTAATMMQALGVTPEVIDRCQNHVMAGSRVRRHYLTHEYTEEKRDAWQRLGTALEAILDSESPPTQRKLSETFSRKVIAASPHGSV